MDCTVDSFPSYYPSDVCCELIFDYAVSMAPMGKNDVSAGTIPVSEAAGIETGTNEDALDMDRLGRKQEFKVLPT